VNLRKYTVAVTIIGAAAAGSFVATHAWQPPAPSRPASTEVGCASKPCGNVECCRALAGWLRMPPEQTKQIQGIDPAFVEESTKLERMLYEERQELAELLRRHAREAFHRRVEAFDAFGQQVGAERLAEQILSQVTLRVIDEKWKDHLYDLDQLRNAITYRSWGQKDPLVEYQREAYDMFVDLMTDLRLTFSEQFLARVQVTAAPPPPLALPVARTYTGPAAPEEGEPVVRREVAGGMVAPDAAAPRAQPSFGGGLAPSQAAAMRAAGISPTPRAPAGGGAMAKVGRNDPCPCGSGKKYKKCHGAGA